jgi:kynurenine 3-monooxygenase
MKENDQSIIIIGAGLAGSLLALTLSQLGFENIHVYEKRDQSSGNSGSKRTIAMSISERGWQALKMVGLYDEVFPHTTPTYGRIAYHPASGRSRQYYGKPPQAIYTINRSFLNNALLRKAESTNRVFFHFCNSVEDIDVLEKTVTLVDADGNRTKKEYAHLFGVDGVFSTVRNILHRDGYLVAEQKKLGLGYKEMVIPYHPETLSQMSNEYVHVYSADNSVLVVLPSNAENCFIANLYAPMDQTITLQSRPYGELQDYFARHFMPLFEYSPSILEQYIANPIANMFTVTSSRWNHQDQILLLGDAAHAIAPFYAMGMNLCFEDCMEFRKVLQENDLSIGASIMAYEQHRRADTDAMAQMAMENYDNLHRSHQHEQKQVWELERQLWDSGCVDWLPEYVAVAFTTQPLRKVLHERNARRAMLLEQMNALIEQNSSTNTAVKPVCC